MSLQKVFHLATATVFLASTSLVNTSTVSAQPKVSAPAPSSNVSAPATTTNQTLQIKGTVTRPAARPVARPTATRPRPKQNFAFACKGTTVVLNVQRPKIPARGIPFIRFTSSGSAYFGGQYSPQARCSEVASRVGPLLLSGNQIKKGVRLTTGKMNGQTVICTAAGGRCQSLVLTLKPQNARNSKRVLGAMQSWIRNPSLAGNVAVIESENVDDFESALEAETIDVEADVQEGIAVLESEDEEFALAGLESEEGEFSDEISAVEAEPDVEAIESEPEEFTDDASALESEDDSVAPASSEEPEAI